MKYVIELFNFIFLFWAQVKLMKINLVRSVFIPKNKKMCVF